MKVWISRDNIESVMDHAVIWNRKPYKDKYGIFWDSVFERNSGWQRIGVLEFKDDFGFTPRKGSCREYELVMKKI